MNAGMKSPPGFHGPLLCHPQQISLVPFSELFALEIIDCKEDWKKERKMRVDRIHASIPIYDTEQYFTCWKLTVLKLN